MSLETLLEAARFLEYQAEAKARGEESYDYETFAGLKNEVRQCNPELKALCLVSPVKDSSFASKINDASVGKIDDKRRLGGIGTREAHNRLEKNRRAQMKECFEILKMEVPNMSSRKISNLTLLRGVMRYMQTLKKQDVELQHEIDKLAKEKTALQQRLKELRREMPDIIVSIKLEADNDADDDNDGESTTTASECGPLSDSEDCFSLPVSFSSAEDKAVTASSSSTSPSSISSNKPNPALVTNSRVEKLSASNSSFDPLYERGSPILFASLTGAPVATVRGLPGSLCILPQQNSLQPSATANSPSYPPNTGCQIPVSEQVQLFALEPVNSKEDVNSGTEKNISVPLPFTKPGSPQFLDVKSVSESDLFSKGAEHFFRIQLKAEASEISINEQRTHSAQPKIGEVKTEHRYVLGQSTGENSVVTSAETSSLRTNIASFAINTSLGLGNSSSGHLIEDALLLKKSVNIPLSSSVFSTPLSKAIPNCTQPSSMQNSPTNKVYVALASTAFNTSRKSLPSLSYSDSKCISSLVPFDDIGVSVSKPVLLVSHSDNISSVVSPLTSQQTSSNGTSPSPIPSIKQESLNLHQDFPDYPQNSAVPFMISHASVSGKPSPQAFDINVSLSGQQSSSFHQQVTHTPQPSALVSVGHEKQLLTTDEHSHCSTGAPILTSSSHREIELPITMASSSQDVCQAQIQYHPSPAKSCPPVLHGQIQNESLQHETLHQQNPISFHAFNGQKEDNEHNSQSSREFPAVSIESKTLTTKSLLKQKPIQQNVVLQLPATTVPPLGLLMSSVRHNLASLATGSVQEKAGKLSDSITTMSQSPSSPFISPQILKSFCPTALVPDHHDLQTESSQNGLLSGPVKPQLLFVTIPSPGRQIKMNASDTKMLEGYL